MQELGLVLAVAFVITCVYWFNKIAKIPKIKSNNG